MDALTFQAEIQRIERLMYRVSRSYLGNDEDAADAVQDALTKAWEKRSHLRDPNQFRAWFMRILTNQCKDALRKRSELWADLKAHDERLYHRCKFSVAGACNLPGTLGGKISIGGYRIAQKLFKFN